MFWEKYGVDNAFLLLAGVLYVTLFLAKRKERKMRRLRLDLFTGLFFIGFALTHDLYRFQLLRRFLLFHYNSFLLFRVAVILILLLPIIFELLYSLRVIWQTKQQQRASAAAPDPPDSS